MSHGQHEPHQGVRPDEDLSPRARRALAMHELLVDKGVIAAGEVEEQALRIESRSLSGGARVVARAWIDPGFKSRLVADSRSAVGELGLSLTRDAELAVVENTESVHHLVVCTLCSCYPTALLGPPPDWYNSAPYRRRAVAEPRAVMREFGLDLDEGVQVRVIDSTADLRYLVLPRRPAGTEDLSEEELAALVTRDSMIGVSEARDP